VTIRTKMISGFGALLLVITVVFGAITYLTFADIINREGQEVLRLKAQDFLLHLHREMGREYRAFHQTHQQWRERFKNKPAAATGLYQTGLARKRDSLRLFGEVRVFAKAQSNGGSELRRHLGSALAEGIAEEPSGPGLRLVSLSQGFFLGELLRGDDNRIEGVLAARLNVARLRSFLAANRNVPGAWLVLSFHRRLLAISAPANPGALVRGEIPSLLGPSWSQKNHVLSAGRDYVLTSEATSQGLQISYILPETFFLKDLSVLKNRILVALLILGYLSVWMVLVISHRITRPLTDLSRASRDIISFNYETPVTVLSRNDEIGVLGESFETMRRKIKELVIQDPLTQTYNRRYLLHMLETEGSKAVRLRQELACIMLDCDHFKRINDRFGHRCGDAILEALGTLLLQEVRPYDTVARYGGEEFTILLPSTDAETAYQVAERVRQRVETYPFSWQGEPIRCTLGMGVSVLSGEDGAAFDLLIDRSDQALYAAKAAGRNRTVVFREESATG
jgi:diguanylate cyclase (GGDEF)-like protein